MLVTMVEDPRSIIIETSTRTGQVALALGEKIVDERQLDQARRHARDLAPAVRDLLKEQSWEAKDIDFVVVSQGPGSYTGLRVGIMSAKAFAYAAGCDLIAVPSFLAIARQAPAEADGVDVFADAQQDRVYVQCFDVAAGLRSCRNEDENLRQDRNPAATSELAIVPFADWLASVSQADQPVWVSGPGLHGKLERLPEHVKIVPEENWTPQAESLLTLALERFRRGDCDDVLEVEPIYLRPSAAEEQWESRS